MKTNCRFSRFPLSRTLAVVLAPSIMLLTSCSTFFGEKLSVVGEVLPSDSSLARVPVTLTPTTRYIQFEGFQRTTSEKQHLQITIINYGSSSVEAKRPDGSFCLISPSGKTQLFNGVPDRTSQMRIWISGTKHR